MGGGGAAVKVYAERDRKTVRWIDRRTQHDR